jgi:initiation factor 1A
MPKKQKCGKNKSNSVEKSNEKLLLADIDGQVYGFIEKALGDRWFDVSCLDNKTRRCRVRSRKIKIKLQDCVIVALRNFDDKTGDIIHKYELQQIRLLQKDGILPMKDFTSGEIKEEEEVFVFDNI